MKASSFGPGAEKPPGPPGLSLQLLGCSEATARTNVVAGYGVWADDWCSLRS